MLSISLFICFRKELFLDSVNLGDNFNPFIIPLHKHEDKQRAQEEFQKVCYAFNSINVNEGEQKVIWSILAAIYHLGCAGIVKGDNLLQKTTEQYNNP